METPPSIVERLVFNKLSAVIHSVIFIVWFIMHWNVSLLTNVVSLEAIYLSIFIGISSKHVHEHVDKSNGKKK